MRLALIGLGKMGYSMTLRLTEGGHEVVAVDRNADLARELATKGAIFGENPADAIAKLSGPRVVWVMVPAQVTDAVIQDVAGKLSKGDIIIDGGNSNWKDSRARAEKLAEKGILFCDAGTSGGVWGLKNGYCLMVGGAPEAVKVCEPIFKTLAPADGYAHVGPAGAGHYVKMVHNGIEYGLMQAYAEGFEIMKTAPFKLDLHNIAAIWGHGSVVRSWLLELLESALKDDSDLHAIKGWVEDSGEGRWTVQAAIDQDVPAPIITLSLQTRFRSRQTESYGAKVLAALRNQFGGHAVKKA
ncbi:MAG TPA: decarboxylating 6-phosphogluconate dehydrogenase [Polyangiaceae bacterium]|jgi:6-phosphogluconate dehydrogenase|nr:decarboxylating 6-phosphogluconate dehydrogenase [Polyangiaceae bacterium]